jgi:hypothetical protein
MYLPRIFPFMCRVPLARGWLYICPPPPLRNCRRCCIRIRLMPLFFRELGNPLLFYTLNLRVVSKAPLCVGGSFLFGDLFTILEFYPLAILGLLQLYQLVSCKLQLYLWVCFDCGFYCIGELGQRGFFLVFFLFFASPSIPPSNP